jgi:hypothetical protein
VAVGFERLGGRWGLQVLEEVGGVEDDEGGDGDGGHAHTETAPGIGGVTRGDEVAHGELQEDGHSVAERPTLLAGGTGGRCV